MRRSAGVILVSLALGTTGFANTNPYAFLNTYPGEQSVGFYSKGSLVSPDVTSATGKGFVVLYPARERSFSSKELRQLLENSSNEMADRFPGFERVQFGDFSAHDGGTLSGHASHQNGLDADLSYFRMDHREQIPGVGDGFDEPFVKNGKITENFDVARNWDFIRFMVSSGLVTRIFVDPVIKKTLCEWAGKIQDASSTEALRVLRPYSNHNAHMHVRIACPKDSPRCIAQESPPVGDGCKEVAEAMTGTVLSLTGVFLLKGVELEIPE